MIGPFTVKPSQIEGTGVNFTPFINELLDVECAAAGMSGSALSVTFKENVGDGGVDAAIEDSPGTSWIPEGSSAWQFKAGDLSPAECKKEIAKNFASDYVRGGAAYVLVLGKDLTDQKLKNRRQALRDEALRLCLVASDEQDRIHVYDAEQLARWASTHKSISLSRLIGGPGDVAHGHLTWSSMSANETGWIPDKDRRSSIEAIRSNFTPEGRQDHLRISGLAGFGKTRLALEALRTNDLRPLVVYVPDEKNLNAQLIQHLLGGDRTSILVIDECDPDQHTKFVGQLPTDSGVRLLTIGPPGYAFQPAGELVVQDLERDEVAQLVRSEFGEFSSEAVRFVVENSGGNPRWALQMAHAVARDPMDAADLIDRNQVEKFITKMIPGGADFLVASFLALLTRVGWEGDKADQLEKLSTFSGIPIMRFEAVGAALENSELLVQHGRYRAVDPHPLAVFLAAAAWKSHGDRIVKDLLPILDEEAGIRLFERLSHLGKFDGAAKYLRVLVSATGPFGDLSILEANRSGRQLTMLAIVLPLETMALVNQLVRNASIEELRGFTNSRRDLVWTLEKLVWHNATFETAADCLLRLAEAENETWANNATGTWSTLFGALLPATSADPAVRLTYLQRRAKSESRFIRVLCIDACGSAIHPGGGETVTVSGELQGGAIVEPRGSAKTWQDAADYKTGLLGILDEFSSDADPEISALAQDHIVEAFRSLADNPLLATRYRASVARLDSKHLRKMRSEALAHVALFERSEAKTDADVAAVQALLASLPEADEVERFLTLSLLNRWDMGDGQFHEQAVVLIREMGVETTHKIVTEVLTTEPEPSVAWDIGRALGEVRLPDSESVLLSVAGKSPGALVGYLQGLYDTGDVRVFEDFLFGQRSDSLSDQQRISIAVRAPDAPKIRSLVLELARPLSVEDAARALWGWRVDLDSDSVEILLDDWMPAIDSEAAYRSAVEWTAQTVYQRDDLEEALILRLHQLVMMRRVFPDVGQHSWKWARLAELSVPAQAAEVAELIVGLIESDGVSIHRGGEEAQLLGRCAAAHPSAVWLAIGEALGGENSWRLRITGRGWLLNEISPDVLDEWVNGSVKKARLVASIASVGGNSPSAAARFLLSKFGDDDDVKSSLHGELISGTWMGSEVSRIEHQIEKLASWADEDDALIRGWAAEMISYLRQAQAAAQLREDEEDWH